MYTPSCLSVLHVDLNMMAMREELACALATIQSHFFVPVKATTNIP